MQKHATNNIIYDRAKSFDTPGVFGNVFDPTIRRLVLTAEAKTFFAKVIQWEFLLHRDSFQVGCVFSHVSHILSKVQSVTFFADILFIYMYHYLLIISHSLLVKKKYYELI